MLHQITPLIRREDAAGEWLEVRIAGRLTGRNARNTETNAQNTVRETSRRPGFAAEGLFRPTTNTGQLITDEGFRHPDPLGRLSSGCF